MTYAAAALTSAEIAGFGNDKPMMVLQQIINPAKKGWTTVGHTPISNDVTDPSTPSTRAYDDIGNLITKTAIGSVAASPKYFNIETTAISFDTLLILGHNLNSGGFADPDSIALEISNSATFTSSIEIAKYTVSGTVDNRILITNLNSEGGSSTYSAGGTAQRYSDVLYARLKIEHAGSLTPEIGEFFLGTRYQLQRNPNLPWNNKNEQSSVTDFTSHSGLVKRYVAYRGQAVRSFEASIADSAEITVVENWFNDTNEGTRPFVYIETPSSSPQALLMILDEAALSFPILGPTERRLRFTMREQPPFLSRE